MTEIMSHTVYEPLADVPVNPFIAGVESGLDPLIVGPTERVSLGVEDLLQLEVLDRLEDTLHGPHQPMLAGSRILEAAQGVRVSTDMLFDGCMPEATAGINKQFVDLRDSLADFAESFEEGSLFNDPNDKSLIEKLAKHQERFIKRAEEREPELVRARELFVARVRYAIDNQGLPLTHEQLDARLDGVQVGFSHPLNSQTGTVARYDAVDRHAFIDIDRMPDEIVDDVFHELFHAVSGTDIVQGTEVYRKLGLLYAGGYSRGQDQTAELHRLWLNEAVTDVLANIMLDEDGELWDFGSDSTSLYFASDDNYELLTFGPLSRVRQSGYRDHKFAMLDATKAIPTRVLLEAYFAQNDDPYVKDQRAGTHAERELQRAFKRTGGVERIRQLRLIDQEFQRARYVVLGANAVQTARHIADQIGAEGTVRVPISARDRQRFNRMVDLRTEFRNAQIAEAKLRVASRGDI